MPIVRIDNGFYKRLRHLQYTIYLCIINAKEECGMFDFKKLVVKYLEEAIQMIKDDDCELSDTEAMDIVKVIAHRPMSKEQACSYLNLSRSRFDDLVRERKIPRGKKRVGFKELYWYQDELDFCKKDK